MRTVTFSKYQGLGNSFLITQRYDYLRKASQLAKLACDKSYGIGADGMMLALENRTEADFDYQMKLYNADGSEAEMSGNGLRCFVHYLINNGLIENPNTRILTDAGILDATALNAEMLILEHEYLDLMEIKVLMGSAKIKMLTDAEPIMSSVNSFIDDVLGVWYVDIGNPHLVIYHNSTRPVNFAELYKKIGIHFKRGVNMEVVNKIANQELNMVVYERGVGPTLACGTGSVASAVCYGIFAGVDQTITVNNPGGQLQVDFVELVRDEYLGYLTGPSQFVATIEMSPEGI
jgi:diaminopimelate epimerase